MQAGLIDQQGVSRWTCYSLKAPREPPDRRARATDDDRIIAYVREHGSINNTECRTMLGVDLKRASYLLKKMAAEGTLIRGGERRRVRYRLP